MSKETKTHFVLRVSGVRDVSKKGKYLNLFYTDPRCGATPNYVML